MDVPADKDISACSMRDGINFHLKPHPVVILEAAPVSLEWNARFSALWRRYRYTIQPSLTPDFYGRHCLACQTATGCRSYAERCQLSSGGVMISHLSELGLSG
ncbi:hypothetical protein PT277_03425 [Acetobacteraceae bacterium ESL0709]|nr:hypothetical protein [Acetobacteraceae bacterium ESL0709]